MIDPREALSAYHRPVQSGVATTAKRGPFSVSAITVPGKGTAYAVVSPGGVPLYTFSDKRAALEEAAVLNESPTAPSPRTRGTPLA
jgi:hypothetical protein